MTGLCVVPLDAVPAPLALALRDNSIGTGHAYGGWREKDSVFVALCEIARLYLHDDEELL